MLPPKQLIEKFYTGFQHNDFRTMQECYHPDVEFTDEVFPILKGKQAKAMWHMLVEGGKDAGLRVKFRDVYTDDARGTCQWEAFYKFSLTGRTIHNQIKATFWMKDGLIIRHIDNFNFWRWTRMAFGLKGLLVGWTPFFKQKVRETVAVRLAKFVERNPEYQ